MTATRCQRALSFYREEENRIHGLPPASIDRSHARRCNQDRHPSPNFGFATAALDRQIDAGPNSVKDIQESFECVRVLPIWILWVKESWAQHDAISTVGRVQGTRQGLKKGSF
ncbi:hypothetical protein EYF80_031371 [Liparis tanakae]|uniref:Uncharacterized protein n=1 Tax=Liparis tanakae TaxID=230148 RepID=A0A4Z2GYT4_9TELE|nr:hypothetical protein EYF80_031371 [Liparis tanakae]